MRTTKAVLAFALAVAVSSLVAFDASATITYNFSFSGGGNVGTGQLTGTDLGGGQISITSGYFNVTAGSIIGVYTLYDANGASSAVFTSPLGAFNVDNQLLTGADPWMNNNGFLFAAGGGTPEVNLWGNSPGNYSLYRGTASGVYDLQYTGAGTFDFTPVPEASQFAIAGVGLLGLVYVGRCAYQRRKVVA